MYIIGTYNSACQALEVIIREGCDHDFTESQDIWWYHPDHLGSSSYLTDWFGQPSHYYDYLPFGENAVEQNNSMYNNVYKFNAKQLDEETGYYYYGARYYEPKTSIWLSVDPLAEKYPGFSPYTYTFQNPLNFVDPTGKEGEVVKPYGKDDPPIYFVKGDCYCSYYDDYGRMVTQSPNGIDDFLNNFETFEDFVPNFERPILHDFGEYSVLFDEVWADKNHQNIEGLKVLALGLLTIADININVVGKGALTRKDFKLNLKFNPKFNQNSGKVSAPEGWTTQASKKGGGTVFKDPNNQHNIIRQMPGNPKSPNMFQRKPYVKFMKEGKFYDVNGKPLPNGDVPEAHIPLSQFNINNMPKF